MAVATQSERAIIGETFRDVTVRVDGQHYVNCTFERCKMEYAGGPPPVFEDCTLIDVGWWFAESAGNTIGFLQSMFNTFGQGGKDLVQLVFKMILDEEVAPGTVHSDAEMIRRDMSVTETGAFGER